MLVLVAPGTSALALDTIEPRSFGYAVGDVLERRVLVDPVLDGTLDPASLPRPGRVGRWFQLREVARRADGVRLLYQLVNAPREPARENLPSLTLRLIAPGGHVRQAEIGPFTVATAPLVPAGPYEGVQDTDVRPDLDPPSIDTSARERRVLAYAVVLALLAVGQCAPWLARRLGWSRAGPFERARRAIARRGRARREGAVSESVGDAGEVRLAALRRLHQALDEAAGCTVALDNLEVLFRRRPWLAPARGRVEQLMAASRQAFFGAGPRLPIAQIQSLAAQLAELERRG